MHLFSMETNHHTVACSAYKVGCHCARQVSSFLALTFKSFTLPFSACCTAPTPRVMASEANQTLHAISEDVTDDTKTASGAESDILMSSSSSNVAAKKMENKDTLMLFDY
jgi:hypothetical protein